MRGVLYYVTVPLNSRPRSDGPRQLQQSRAEQMCARIIETTVLFALYVHLFNNHLLLWPPHVSAADNSSLSYLRCRWLGQSLAHVSRCSFTAHRRHHRRLLISVLLILWVLFTPLPPSVYIQMTTTLRLECLFLPDFVGAIILRRHLTPFRDACSRAAVLE